MPRSTLVFLALLSFGCDSSRPKPDDATTPPAKAAAVDKKPRFVRAPAGDDFAAVVRDEAAKAKAAGRTLVVYVGAPWCEPCQHFHRALDQGKLDDAFAGLTLLELDLDVDKPRLVRAGYDSKYVPLFAVPGSDGRMTRFIEGSIKGEGAVAEITPRLTRLLAGAP